MITLTLRNMAEVEPMLNRLIDGFRRLRSRHIWSDNVAGGCYVIELTHSSTGWHVHLHALCLSRFIPQHHLSDVWTRLTRSKIVDIRRCDPHDLTGYVTKYLTTFDIPAELRYEANAAMQGRRLWSPFGICHAVNLQYHPIAYACPQCHGTSWICPAFGHSVDWEASARAG